MGVPSGVQSAKCFASDQEFSMHSRANWMGDVGEYDGESVGFTVVGDDVNVDAVGK